MVRNGESDSVIYPGSEVHGSGCVRFGSGNQVMVSWGLGHWVRESVRVGSWGQGECDRVRS